MKQLTKTLLISILFAGQVSYADAPKANPSVKTDSSLNSMLDAYKAVVVSADSVKALDFTYPKVFALTPKAQLVQLIKQQESSGMPKPKISNMKQTPLLPIKKYSKGSYTLVNYEMDMKMNFAQKGREDMMDRMLKNPKELESFQTMMKNMFSATLGKDATIAFEKNSFIANIHQKSKYIAINEENKGWKIVELSVPTANTLERILPKEIYANYKPEIDKLKLAAEDQMKALMRAMGK